MKIAVLSNVNLNGIIRLLKRDFDIYDAEGYGNEIGILMNPKSSLYQYNPDFVFLIEDTMEIICHQLEEQEVKKAIENWFANIGNAVRSNIIYYISDAYLFGQELSVLVDKGKKKRIETIWQKELENFILKNRNVRIFPYHTIIEQHGETNAFSMKMWYMGKILHSVSMQKIISETIKEKVKMELTVPKKLLLVDLDNTLWGGLAGENDITPIILSENQLGLAYKNVQRVLYAMKEQGVLLGIVSKNNEEDALDIINQHPHMVLKSDDFVTKKINWNSKPDNIIQIVKELNIGIDSVVFFDDNPSERKVVETMLPEVTVVDFPNRPEQLPDVLVDVWKNYFERPIVISEDKDKTKQYLANSKRKEIQKAAETFEGYLKELEIRLVRKDPSNYVERISQLLNKTNQFNLTTKRHSINSVQDVLMDKLKVVYAYQVADCFGEEGLVSVAIVDISKKTAVIEEFVMSCRVMGKNIENAIIEDIEDDLIERGFEDVIGEYVETSKNRPVKTLYPLLGYHEIKSNNEVVRYQLSLQNRTKREYYLEKKIEERI